MGVRMTQTIANDADLHISLVINVSRCQPLPRFETGVRIPVGTPALLWLSDLLNYVRLVGARR